MNVPYIFSPGFAARSGEVNANFAALADALTVLQAKVASIETVTAVLPIAGTYSLIGFQNGLIPAGVGAIIEGITYRGTVTLTAQGGATLSVLERKMTLRVNVNSPSTREYQEIPDPTKTGTWDQSDPTVSLVLKIDGEPVLRFGRGSPRLFIGTFINPSDGSHVVLFLIRNPDPVAAT